MAFLSVKDLYVNYGAIKAIQGISLEVEQGEIVTLIGSNGAGKTSTMNTIAGLVKAASGSILFKGEEIANKKPKEIVSLGLSLSPEGRQVFPQMSVKENLELGAYTRSKEDKEEGLANAYRLFPKLEERKSQAAGTLSGGEQQMLAVARALMSKPDLLMLDEPSLGLAPLIIRDIFNLIRQVNQETGTTVLLVEQNAKMALEISHRGYVLETGTIALTDTAANLLKSDKVREAYLGG
ncbi:ABC transporter ATP-binding protein [Pseudoflavonifractor phocaeensis]|uniref:ABC transporter ATP-binding protein n=1 Tax=Pseudoflavonifractor phocaeensis TaxID=1870988 RepID=UPI003090D9A5|nr:ABC transporter ATP-binding protein [Oscillospiraceae bacterium]